MNHFSEFTYEISIKLLKLNFFKRVSTSVQKLAKISNNFSKALWEIFYQNHQKKKIENCSTYGRKELYLFEYFMDFKWKWLIFLKNVSKFSLKIV